MTYQPRPFSSGDTLASSRDPIRTNFQIIEDDFAVNHVAYNEAGEGKHKFLQMPEQTSDPATATNEVALYAKEGVGPAEANLFLRDENSAGGGGNVYQMTRTDDTNYATFAQNTSTKGWTFVAGGMLLSYGLATSSGASLPNTTVTFPKEYTNAIYSVTATILTTVDSRFFVEIYDVTEKQFRAVTRDSGGSKTGGVKFYWQAIGV
jgi:hypothetical protein